MRLPARSFTHSKTAGQAGELKGGEEGPGVLGKQLWHRRGQRREAASICSEPAHAVQVLLAAVNEVV